MTIDATEACLNVLCGLNADGRNRLQDALRWAQEEDHKGNPALLRAMPELCRRVERGDDYTGECNECNSWDGRSRRCYCGNRRVYWCWDERFGWSAEAY